MTAQMTAQTTQRPSSANPPPPLPPRNTPRNPPPPPTQLTIWQQRSSIFTTRCSTVLISYAFATG
eukprot:586084-Rhodomonas_salina.3